MPILTYHPLEYESNIAMLIPDLGTITVDNVSVPMVGLYIGQQGQFLARETRKCANVQKANFMFATLMDPHSRLLTWIIQQIVLPCMTTTML